MIVDPKDRAALVGLVAVSAAAAFGCARIFTSWSFLAPVLACVVIAHGCAVVTRKRAIVMQTAVAIGVGIVTVGIASLPEFTTFGIPTLDTVRAATSALGDAWRAMGVVQAPIAPSGGFLVAICIAAWSVAWISDRLAFSLAAKLEATVPGLLLFIVITVLSGPDHRLVSAAAMAGALVVYAAGVQSGSKERAHSLHIGPPTVMRSNFVGGVVIGVVALALAVAGVAAVPGVSGRGVVDLRDHKSGNKTRSVVSPFVDIRNRLLTQSDLELFTVQSTNPQYWRLMALDDFDGNLWSSNQSFKNATGDLALPESAAFSMTKMTATFSMLGLSGPWAPAPYLARGVQDTSSLLWDRASATLIVDADLGSVDGLQYRVNAGVPNITANQARRAWGEIPKSVRDRDLLLPDNFPERLRSQARTITSHAHNDFDKAMALQDFFRDPQRFTYSLDVPAGQSVDAMTNFLDTGVGYCEQFAGTYSALARAAGLPSRVVVGFTPGRPDPKAANTYVVDGRYAHAWPEVFIAGVGWLSFEPTPGRGNPAAAYTGAQPEQASPERNRAAAPVPTPTAAPSTVAPNGTTSVPNAPTTVAQPQSSNQPLPNVPSEPTHRSVPGWLIAVALGVVLVVIFGALSIRRNTLLTERRRAGAQSPADHVLVAWAEVIDAWRPARVSWASTETHLDFGNRLAARVSTGEGGAGDARRCDRLAHAASKAAWSRSGVSPATADQALDDAHKLVHLAHAQLSPTRRFLLRVVPRRRALPRATRTWW